jgi:hypothetical protein
MREVPIPLTSGFVIPRIPKSRWKRQKVEESIHTCASEHRYIEDWRLEIPLVDIASSDFPIGRTLIIEGRNSTIDPHRVSENREA